MLKYVDFKIPDSGGCNDMMKRQAHVSGHRNNFQPKAEKRCHIQLSIISLLLPA